MADLTPEQIAEIRAEAEAPVADGPVPAPVGWHCDHSGEEPGQRTHEGWRWDGQEERVWARQPTVVSAFTRPGEVRCPRAVRVYAVDAPALLAQLAAAREGKVEQMLGRLDDWSGDLAHVVAERDRARTVAVKAETVLGEQIDRAITAENELAEERLTSDTLRASRDQLHAELTAIREHNETAGQVMRGVLDSVRAGRIDDDEAVRLIEQRLIHPLTAQRRQARHEAERHFDHLYQAHPRHFTPNVLGQRLCGCDGQWPCREHIPAEEVQRVRADRDSLRHLAETALHLRRHGENAPGGTETWAQWDRDAQTRLRALGDPDPEGPC